MLLILEEWEYLGRLEGHLVVHVVKHIRIGIEISTCSFIQSTNREKNKVLNNRNQTTKKVRSLSSLASRYLADQSAVAKGVSALQRGVSESSHRLYSTQAFMISFCH